MESQEKALWLKTNKLYWLWKQDKVWEPASKKEGGGTIHLHSLCSSCLPSQGPLWSSGWLLFTSLLPWYLDPYFILHLFMSGKVIQWEELESREKKVRVWILWCHKVTVWCYVRDFLLSETQVTHMLKGYNNYCSGLNSLASRIHIHREPQKMTLSGNWVFVDIIVKMRSYRMRVSPQSNDTCGVLIRRKDTQRCIQRRTPPEDGDGSWSDSSTSQEVPRIAGNTRS